MRLSALTVVAGIIGAASVQAQPLNAGFDTSDFRDWTVARGADSGDGCLATISVGYQTAAFGFVERDSLPPRRPC